MIHRRSLLCVCVLAIAGVGRAPAEDLPGSEHPRRHRYRGGDHDSAHRALRDGRALPLAEILGKIKGDLGGDVIDIGLKARGGSIVYKLKILKPGGELVEVNVDALTGAILKQEDE